MHIRRASQKFHTTPNFFSMQRILPAIVFPTNTQANTCASDTHLHACTRYVACVLCMRNKENHNIVKLVLSKIEVWCILLFQLPLNSKCWRLNIQSMNRKVENLEKNSQHCVNLSLKSI